MWDLGKTFYLYLFILEKTFLFFKKKKMLFSSPHSSILLPEMDVMTGPLGASMDQDATTGQDLEVGTGFDQRLCGANHMSPGMPDSNLLREQEVEFYFI